MPRTITIQIPDEGEVFAIAYDARTCDSDVACIDQDYSVITGPTHRVTHTQIYSTGTVLLTIKRASHPDVLRARATSSHTTHRR